MSKINEITKYKTTIEAETLNKIIDVVSSPSKIP